MNDLKDQLEEALGQIDDASNEICDNYKLQVNGRLQESVSHFIHKNKLDNKVEICKDFFGKVHYQIVNDDCTYTISLFCFDGNLEISVSILTRMPDKRSQELLDKLAQSVGQSSISNVPSLQIPVSEDDAAGKTIEIIGKICGEE